MMSKADKLDELRDDFPTADSATLERALDAAKGDLAAARRHLERAHESAGHPEIARHLGEVRWAQGDHQAARQIWQDALAAHPDDADLKQTMEAHRP